MVNKNNYSDEDDSHENSPEDSPQDEDPPYKTLNTTLKRYGTLSSLEKMPSDETDEKVYGSSDEEQDEYDDDGEYNFKLLFVTKGGLKVRTYTTFTKPFKDIII